MPLPDNYEFVAWVQMRDFIFNYGDWTCYGLIAQNPSVANDYVLAIRGTSDRTEWWDDLTSMLPWASMPGFGDVGYGFYSIYQTLRIDLSAEGRRAMAGCGVGRSGESLEAAGTFRRSSRCRGAAAMPPRNQPAPRSCRGAQEVGHRHRAQPRQRAGDALCGAIIR